MRALFFSNLKSILNPDGSQTCTSERVNDLLARTPTHSTHSSPHAATTSDPTKWQQQSFSGTHSSLKVNNTGVTFNKVDHLKFNSRETNEISSREDHKTYENSKDYPSSQSTSSFKR